MLVQLLAAAIAVLSFGIVFQARKKSLPFLALTGIISFYSFLLLAPYNNLFATFIATLVIGICSELFARLIKLPATVFITCGIIPLVPGISAYNTTLHLLNEDYIAGISVAIETILAGGAIALAIAITSTIARHYKKN